MDFDEAEARFRSLRARQKGAGSMAQDQFEEEVRRLTLQDDCGVWWAIHPETGQWFSFDGTEWIHSTRPTSGRSSMPRLGYTWLPLAIGLTVLLVCLLLAGLGGGPAWQALTQHPVFTRTPVLGWPTDTPSPTTVRLPTPLAPSPTPVPVLARVTASRVNVRAGPSLQAQVMTTIPKDQRITVIARSEDAQWYQAIYQQGAKPGWIFAETLQIIEGDAQALAVVRP